MKKSLVCALIVGTTSLMAAKVGDVGVGFEFGGLNSDATSKVNGVSSDGDIDTTYEAIRVGKYFDFGRLGLAVGKINKDKGTDGAYIGVNYDYMFYNDSKFIPFVGGVVAYNKNTWEGNGISIDHNGMQYGLETGVVYDLNDKFEIEAGARYLKSNVKGDTTVSGNKIELEVDSDIQYYLGLNYKF